MPLQLIKEIICFVSAIFIVSCQSGTIVQQDTTIPGSHSKLLVLPDSLGSVEIIIPGRYDTAFNWTHYSDCSGCGERKYRFQSKGMPVFKESGWMWYDLPDSVDRFTVAHSDRTEKRGWTIKEDTAEVKRLVDLLHKFSMETAKGDREMQHVKNDTVQYINGSWFSIITGEHYDSISKIFSRYVVGISSIRKNEISFKFKLLTKNNDSISKNFIDQSLQMLRKIKIKDGG